MMAPTVVKAVAAIFVMASPVAGAVAGGQIVAGALGEGAVAGAQINIIFYFVFTSVCTTFA